MLLAINQNLICYTNIVLPVSVDDPDLTHQDMQDYVVSGLIIMKALNIKHHNVVTTRDIICQLHHDLALFHRDVLEALVINGKPVSYSKINRIVKSAKMKPGDRYKVTNRLHLNDEGWEMDVDLNKCKY